MALCGTVLGNLLGLALASVMSQAYAVYFNLEPLDAVKHPGHFLPVKENELLNIYRMAGVNRAEPLLEIPVVVILALITAITILTGGTDAETMQVRTGDIIRAVEDTLYVQPATNYDLHAVQNARVIQVPVDTGQQVKKGIFEYQNTFTTTFKVQSSSNYPPVLEVIHLDYA